MNKILWTLFALVLLTLVTWMTYRDAVQTADDTPLYSPLVSRPCDALRYTDRKVLCGVYYPGGDSGQFAMPYVIFPYTGADAEPSPLVHISGGPGDGMQTGPERLRDWAYWLEDVQLKRDLVIYDQRGLKPGKPLWECPAYSDLTIELLAENLTLAQEYQRSDAVVQGCIAAFDNWLKDSKVAAIGGIKSITTASAASDLNGMLAALGYSEWNLWGISYGSRLALIAAQQSPETTRSLLLDSPYPLDRGRLSARPAMYSAALTNFWEACRHNIDLCGADAADPEALFWRVMNGLQQTPLAYRVKTPAGTSISVVLNDHRFLSLAMFALHDHRLYPELLRSLMLLDGGEINPRNAEDSDPVQFLLDALLRSAMDADFNTMMYFAIECNDNLLEAEQIYIQAAKAQPRLYPYLALDARYNPCISPLFNPKELIDTAPLVTTPALIIAGGRDPVTPVEWSESLAARLPHAALVVVPTVAHAVLPTGGCSPAIIETFLKNPDNIIDTDGDAIRGMCSQ